MRRISTIALAFAAGIGAAHASALVELVSEETSNPSASANQLDFGFGPFTSELGENPDFVVPVVLDLDGAGAVSTIAWTLDGDSFTSTFAGPVVTDTANGFDVSATGEVTDTGGLFRDAAATLFASSISISTGAAFGEFQISALEGAPISTAPATPELSTVMMLGLGGLAMLWAGKRARGGRLELAA